MKRLLVAVGAVASVALWPAGAAVSVGMPTTLMLTPLTATNVVGQPHTVTATLRDDLGRLLPGFTIDFSVGPSVPNTFPNPSGEEEFRDQGPAQPMNVHSIKITAVTCRTDRTMGTIFGEATIDGSGDRVFRIDVTDPGEPGTNDTYGITLQPGYQSGQLKLLGGNIEIH